MIEYRPFRNCDPPAITEIWASQPPCRGILQTMTPAILDQLVLSKPYFDRHGLLVATEEGRAVGLVHAGFGPTVERTALDPRRGILGPLFVVPHPQRAAIAGELLRLGEDYLRSRGAREVFGGGCEGVNPFYLGLYGGAGSPGILNSDTLALEAFSAAGYEVGERCRVFQRDLAGFRAPVDRQSVELKRKLVSELSPAPDPANWWEACLFAYAERIRGTVAPRGAQPVGVADFWDLEPLASSWGVHAVGLLRMSVNHVNTFDAQAVATHVLAESLRALQAQGVTRAEVQASSGNGPLSDICQRLGFQEVAEGISFRKEV
jgi:predicted N-acetyltransferase YhbS